MPASYIAARDLDITNPDHVKQIVLEIENESNRRRRSQAWVANQCLEGNQKEYVEAQLAVQYPKTHKKFRVGDISIVKKVNDKQTKAYKNPPVRKCKKDSETEELETIYKENHFHRSFKEFDSIFNLHKYACLWLTWLNPEDRDAEEGRYVAHALAPYEYDLVRDQTSGEPIIFILNYPDQNVTRQAGGSDGIEQTISESQSDTSAQSRVYSMWSRRWFVKVTVTRIQGNGNSDDAKENISIRYTNLDANKVGRLPITYVQKDNAVDYPITSNLASQSINWNVSFSDLKTASSTQGHGQLVISYPEGQKIKDFSMGMHTSISLPQIKKPESPKTEAQYISASPDLLGQLNVLKFDMSNILDDHGIKAKGTIEGGAEKFASGFDRLLSEADVQDFVEDNQTVYADELEPDFFLNVKAHESAMGQNTFATTEMLEVHFEKPKVLISDKETLDNIEKREKLGTLLPWEKHIILNPNLTKEQAMEREEEIVKAQEEKIKRMQALMPDAPEEDEVPPIEGE